jgi:hypothetical protein
VVKNEGGVGAVYSSCINLTVRESIPASELEGKPPVRAV